MFYLDLSYRDMEEWLLAGDQVRQVLELPRVPDHTTLQRTYKKLRMQDLEKMKKRLLTVPVFRPDRPACTTSPARGASTGAG